MNNRAREAAAILGHLGGLARAESLSVKSLKEIAREGGKARAQALTAEQRRKIAKKAIATRWAKKREGK